MHYDSDLAFIQNWQACKQRQQTKPEPILGTGIQCRTCCWIEMVTPRQHTSQWKIIATNQCQSCLAMISRMRELRLNAWRRARPVSTTTRSSAAVAPASSAFLLNMRGRTYICVAVS